MSGPPEVPGLQPSEVSRQAESTVASGATGTTRYGAERQRSRHVAGRRSRRRRRAWWSPTPTSPAPTSSAAASANPAVATAPWVTTFRLVAALLAHESQHAVGHHAGPDGHLHAPGPARCTGEPLQAARAERPQVGLGGRRVHGQPVLAGRQRAQVGAGRGRGVAVAGRRGREDAVRPAPTRPPVPPLGLRLTGVAEADATTTPNVPPPPSLSARTVSPGGAAGGVTAYEQVTFSPPTSVTSACPVPTSTTCRDAEQVDVGQLPARRKLRPRTGRSRRTAARTTPNCCRPSARTCRSGSGSTRTGRAAGTRPPSWCAA